ncbi:MAG: hypothetical protein ACOZQL_32255 [Myxococcota bacterium]
MDKKGWYVSAVRVGGLARQLEKRGLTAAVLEHCRPETRSAIGAPHGVREHAGELLLDLNEAIVKVVGLETFAELNYEALRSSYGAIVRPMVLIALTLAGKTPATTLSRIPRSLSEVLPGVRGEWSDTGERSGRLAVEYPSPVAAHTEYAWRGALRFVAELSGTPAKIDRAAHDGAKLTFDLSW